MKLPATEKEDFITIIGKTISLIVSSDEYQDYLKRKIDKDRIDWYIHRLEQMDHRRIMTNLYYRNRKRRLERFGKLNGNILQS